jgi:creatinine amidohydrolase
VRVDLLAPGTTTPIQELMPALRADGVRAVSRSGVLGDPTGASADEGRRLLEQVVNRVARETAGRGIGPDGRLEAGERHAVTR